jgi:hypothetical protein
VFPSNLIYYGFLLKIPPPSSETGNNGAANPPASGSNSNKGPRLTPHERKSMTVSVSQHEIIVGSMLGDMCAVRPTPNRNCRLSMNQSNLSYLLSLAASLSTLVRQPNVTLHNKFGKLGPNTMDISFLPCLCLVLTSTANGSIRKVLSLDVIPRTKQGIKIVPTDIADHLTPLGLAHWYMQDGSKTTDNGIIFATLCFSEAEIQLLIQTLSTKLGLNCTQQKMATGNQNALYVRRASIPTFKELVRPHIHSSMLYKLPTK